MSVFRETRSPYRTHAGIALAVRGQEALKALTADLKADSVTKRAAAIFWLSHVPRSLSGPPLIEALRDPQPGIRQLADWLLRRKTGNDWNDLGGGYSLGSQCAFLAAWEQLYNSPSCDSVGVAQHDASHGWVYYNGWHTQGSTFGGACMMIRCVVDENPAVAPSSIGRVKALYY